MTGVASNLASLRQRAERDLQVPASLHDYQWEGVAFLFHSRGALLADEMGLGKTVQAAVALALLLQMQDGINRALIVSPASLTINWIMEIGRWAPSITACRVIGDARAREAYYLLPIPVLVASYEQVRFDALDRIPTDTFDLVVLDEAQRIKNSDSATAFACRLLPRTRAWALSGTPLENTEADTTSILRFLDPSLPSVLSKRRVSQELEARMVRRRKSDVRGELPPVLLQDLQIELTAEQRDAYDNLWFNRMSVIAESTKEDLGSVLLALITRLKILCNYEQSSQASCKLDALQAVIDGAGSDARILVFSQFVETLRWLSPRVGLPYDQITGSMPTEARYEAIASFKSGATPRALLISLRAGGLGLNLGDATHVVIFDRWWNPAVEIQAVYRAHRFEREAPLHVIRFLVQDTVEERIAQILERKEQLFDEIVETVDSRSYHFTRDELLRILELGPGELPRA